MRTNCPASNASGAPSTRSVNSASVHCRFSMTLPSSQPLMDPSLDPSLDPVGLHMQILHFATQHHNRALAAVVAGVGELEGIGARDAQLAFFVARKPDACKRHRIVEELQVVALARRAPGAHRALARPQAVGPQQDPAADGDDGRKLPHQRLAFTRSAPFSAIAMTAALMLPEGTAGMTEASITLRFWTLFTRKCSSTTAPMLHVDTGWNTVSPVSRQNASQSASLCTCTPGRNSSAT